MNYVVQPGDTLNSIAVRFGVPIQELIRVNNIRPPYVIYIGQTLFIPTGRPGPGPGPRPEPSDVERRLRRLEQSTNRLEREVRELDRRVDRLEQRVEPRPRPRQT